MSRLFVVPEFRRLAVATALMRRVTEWAAEHPCRLVLDVVEGPRSAAIAFYERTGWRHTDTTRADWATPEGAPVHLRHYTLTA